MSRPILIVTFNDEKRKFWPRLIDRDVRQFTGTMYRVGTKEEYKTLQETLDFAIDVTLPNYYETTVSFDDVSSANVEAAHAFRLDESFKVWSSGYGADQKLDAYKNSLKNGVK